MKIDPGLKSKPMDQGGAPKDKFADETKAKPDDGGGKLKRTEERTNKHCQRHNGPMG